MARGDHIFVRRFGGVYSHHGIDCGGGKVIHYTGYTPLQSEVRETSIETFMNGGEVETRDYQEFEQLLLAREGLTSSVSSRFHKNLDRWKGLPGADGGRSADAVVERASTRLGEATFDFAMNNCEHFATWCKTGLSGSAQIESMWRTIVTPPNYFRYATSKRMVSFFQTLGWNR